MSTYYNDEDASEKASYRGSDAATEHGNKTNLLFNREAGYPNHLERNPLACLSFDMG